MPPQSTYLIRPGTSADQLAEQRQAAIAMLNEASSTKPVQHWTQILGQMAKGGLSGYEIGEAQREGRRAQDEAGGLFSEAFASLGGSSRVPGAEVAPQASAAVAPSSPARGAAGAAGRQDQMAPTSDMLDMVRKEEGFAPVAKWDVRQHSGGYGSKAAPGEQFDQAKAEQYLQRDGGPVLQWVNSNAPGASDLQKRALVSFGYNLGVDDLEKLKPDIQRGDWNRVGERMMSFNQAATGPGGALQPMDALTRRRGREAAMIRGGGAGGPVSIAAPETDEERENGLIQKLYRNEQTRPVATALFSAKLAKDKDKKRHVVGPNASLVDDNGGLLYRGPEEDATAKARQQAIGKGQGEARLALPAAVSRAGETVGILEKLRNHPGLDSGTGATSIVASRVPGSDAYDFEQLRQQAQGTAFLTAIGEMRGTGAISNVEGEAATQAVGRMKGAQSKEAFLEALGDYERVVRTGVINTYRNAGLEVPPELMAARPAPGGGAPSAAPGAPSSAPGSAAAARPASGAIKAPDGLQEGMTLRDTGSGEMMTVRGGMLVPAGSPAPAASGPAAGGPASPARGMAGASDMGTAPAFKGNRGNPGDYREDRIALLENPSGTAIEAFNQIWGAGMAQKAIQREAASAYKWRDGGGTRPQGRYGYKLGQ
jgi:GH24 family phage-related lysozyme (muramidase)